MEDRCRIENQLGSCNYRPKSEVETMSLLYPDGLELSPRSPCPKEAAVGKLLSAAVIFPHVREIPTGKAYKKAGNVQVTRCANKVWHRIAAPFRFGVNVVRRRFGRPTGTRGVIGHTES